MRTKCVRAAWSFALCLSVALTACDDENNENDGPVVPPPVDESIDLTASEAYANCFIVTEADEYRFATRKVDGSDVEGIVSVDWLWSTKNAAGNPLVSEVSYKDCIVHFTSDGTEGNTVLAAFDAKGEVIWSWHLWMTDQPELFAYDEGGELMDRNLGATSALEADGAASFGLLYQWGRKDPFVGAKELGKDAPIGGASETAAFGTQTAAYEKNTIDQTAYAFDVIGNDDNTITDCVAYAVQHPTTFIKYVVSVGNSGVSTWFNSDLSNFSDLWGAVSGRKSVYDPCPAGYKVPVDSAEAWGGFAKADVTSSAGSFGVTLNEAFYPCSGWRDVSGMLKQVGTYAKAASATAPTNQANILQIMYYKATAAATTYTTMFSNSGKSFIAGGIPVRCVKE